jgi:hypothetical protein
MLNLVAIGFAQKTPQPSLVWSIGPLTKGEAVMDISFGSGDATFGGPHVDSQTRSIFSATRSIVFAGDRIVLASKVGERRISGTPAPAEVYKLLSLDLQTGKVKKSREVIAHNSLQVFAANDGSVIVSGRNVMRLTPDLKDAGSLEFAGRGHTYGDVENISPDGSTLGNATSPGFELINASSLKVTELTMKPSTATSVNNEGFVTDNPYGYTDAAGTRSISHAECGGRPQFLTNTLILETGCPSPIVIDLRGGAIRTMPIKGGFSFAGVAQDGTRFALQDMLKSERFTIYSTKTLEPIAEVAPEVPAEGQSWTAFSPDGLMFVVGSPLKLALYRIP